MTGVIVWKELGFGVILFLARLLSAARRDLRGGAGSTVPRFFRLHRYVTVPQLGSVIAFYVVVEAITMVSWVFNYVYVISNGTGGPGDATPGDRALHLPDRLPVLGARSRRGRGRDPVRGHARLRSSSSSGSSGARACSAAMSRALGPGDEARRARAGVVRRALPGLRDGHGGVQDADRASSHDPFSPPFHPTLGGFRHGARTTSSRAGSRNSAMLTAASVALTLAVAVARRLGVRALELPRARRPAVACSSR